MRKISISSDHAGFELKESIKKLLIKKKFLVLDLGPRDDRSVDYPDYAKKLAKNIISKKFKLGRVRILLKEPRSTLSWHRDPEPRLHIPIVTNPGCIMVIEEVAKHLPADGSAWITNNMKYHNFFNGGEENRIHLVACLTHYKFN